MKVMYPGHRFELDTLGGTSEHKAYLQFVQKSPHPEQAGVICQEVIRALIARVQYLDTEISWGGNEAIVNHLRYALVLFECRALIRKVEKGELEPEHVRIGEDGHFRFGGSRERD